MKNNLFVSIIFVLLILGITFQGCVTVEDEPDESLIKEREQLFKIKSPEGKRLMRIHILYNTFLASHLQEHAEGEVHPVIITLFPVPQKNVNFYLNSMIFEQDGKQWQANPDEDSRDIYGFKDHNFLNGKREIVQPQWGVLMLPKWFDMDRQITVYYGEQKIYF